MSDIIYLDEGPQAAKPAAPDGIIYLDEAPAAKPALTRGQQLMSGAADAVDFVVDIFSAPIATAGATVSRVQGLANQTLGIGKPRTREDIAKESQETANRIRGVFGEPARKVLTSLGLLPEGSQGPIGEAFSAAMGLVARDAKAVEERTGGKVLADDVMYTVESLFGVLGAKGVQLTGKHVVDKAKAKEALAELDRLKAERGAETRVEEQAAAEATARPVDAAGNARARATVLETKDVPAGKPSKTTPGVSSAASPQRTAELRRLRAEMRARFSDEAYSPRGEGWELSSPQSEVARADGRREAQAFAERLPPSGEPKTRLAEPTILEADTSLPQPFGRPGEGIDTSFQEASLGMAARRRGLASEVPESARTRLSVVGDSLQSGVQKMREGRMFDLTSEERIALKGAGVAGAAGLGVLFALSEDNPELATAMAAGGVIMSKGRAGLEALRAMPDAAPLGAFKRELPWTFSTLEALPENRHTFGKDSVRQLLKREGVTKMERDVLESVLAKSAGDQITAKELVVGMREATGDFELTRAETPEYATYGLEAIGRFREMDPNVYVFADMRRDGVDISEMETPPATTTLYKSSALTSTANHFGEPGYFAHTRSFTENGVEHVVEVQSDLAQKAGRQLTPDERAALEGELEAMKLEEDVANNARIAKADAGDVLFERLTREGRDATDPAWQRHLEEGRTLRDQAIALSRRNGVRRGEIFTKLEADKEAAASAPVEPMLKHWYKRVIREKVAEASKQLSETQALIQQKRATIAARQAELQELSTSSEWGKAHKTKLENEVYDLDVMAMDLKNGHVSEGTVRQYMLRSEAEMPSDVRKRWREYYENNADETEGFLRPGKGEEGPWGNSYAANFPKVLADFLRRELGQSDKTWYEADIQGYKDDIARLESADRVIRFADADTVAKVEGWPDRQQAFDASWGDRPPPNVKRPADIERFSPEHQSIYNRYAGDITKFYKQLGAKHVTDDKGHGWWEIPLTNNPALEKGGLYGGAGSRRIQMGAVDPAVMNAIGLLGAGAGLGYLFSTDPRDRGLNAALGAAVVGLGLLASRGIPAVSEAAKTAARAVENLGGNLSAEARLLSQPILRSLRQHARQELTVTRQRLDKIADFAKGMRSLPADRRDAVGLAVLTGSREKVVQALAKAGRPELLAEWEKTRGMLAEVGKDLVDNRLLKGLKADYFPRMVTDIDGLKEALGKESGDFLDRKLKEANVESVKATGDPLTAFEASLVVNKHLEEAIRQGPGTGRPGFLRKRTIEDVSEAIYPFYAPPSEAIVFYTRGATRSIERAKFFGRHLRRDPETGRVDLTKSIGEVVHEEYAKGKLTREGRQRLEELLRSYFGPGAMSADAVTQSVRNVTQTMLLANPFSSLRQLSDVAIAGALHGYANAIRGIIAMRGDPAGKVGVADFGLINHITEEFVQASRNPLIIRGVEVSTANVLDKSLKAVGFLHMDQLTKNVHLNAAWQKYKGLAKTEKGRAEIVRRYGEYFGDDIGKLVGDLKAGGKTDLTRELLFAELSDAQPVSRLEMPKAFLDAPNARFLYTLKGWWLKQLNLIRERGFREIGKGDTAGVKRGMEFLLRYGLAAGIAGATIESVISWLKGDGFKGVEGEAIADNMMKTFGWSQYVLEKGQKDGALAAIVPALAPPYRQFQDLLERDPRAISYIPVIGGPVYAMTDVQRERELAKRQAKDKRDREAGLTDAEREHRDLLRERARQARRTNLERKYGSQ